MPTRDYSEIVGQAYRIATLRGSTEFDTGDVLQSFLTSQGIVRQLLDEFGLNSNFAKERLPKLRLLLHDNPSSNCEPRQSKLVRAWGKTFGITDDDRFEDSFDLFQVVLSFNDCLAQKLMQEGKVDLAAVSRKVKSMASSRPNFSKLLIQFGNHPDVKSLVISEQEITALLESSVASGNLDQAKNHHDDRTEVYSNLRRVLTSLSGSS
jgi:hypothetical protein